MPSKQNGRMYLIPFETNKLRDKVDNVLERYRIVKEKIEDEKERFSLLTTQRENTLEAQDIVQIVSQTIQQQAHEKLAKVVTACLQNVFTDRNYEFEIKFEKKRKKTEAKLILVNDGHDIENPLAEDSGGVVDIAAFVLRLSCLMLHKPPVRKLIIMDEPFKNLSEEYLGNARMMLEKLSKDFKIQFIIVTHIKELMVGKIVKL